jgi:hypothetical protein
MVMSVVEPPDRWWRDELT